MRPAPPTRDRPRHPHIEQRLRRQPARAARLEQDALVALRQHDLRRARPRLAAEDLQIGRNHEAGPWHVDRAHGTEACAGDRSAAGRARW